MLNYFKLIYNLLPYTTDKTSKVLNGLIWMWWTNQKGSETILELRTMRCEQSRNTTCFEHATTTRRTHCISLAVTYLKLYERVKLNPVKCMTVCARSAATILQFLFSTWNVYIYVFGLIIVMNTRQTYAHKLSIHTVQCVEWQQNLQAKMRARVDCFVKIYNKVVLPKTIW